MAQSVLEYLERSAEKYPNKEAYEDSKKVMTFSEVQETAKRIGSVVAATVGMTHEPAAVFMDKNVESIVSFLGIVYSGNFYCPLDSKMPLERIHTIMGVLCPKVIITDAAHLEKAKEFAGDSTILVWEELITAEINEALLSKIREQASELDPLYVLFTSGSTGVPKGVLLNHRVVTNYMEWLEQTFDYNSDDVFGNQAPLYFDVSVHDIYGAMYFGAKMVIIPQSMFSFPIKLVALMNEKKISTFLWVPSALCIVANLRTFKADQPKYLRHIMFAGEVLPWKQLQYWREYIPDAVYANLYGPTETFVCTGYVMNGNEPEGEALPIGRPISNSHALILDENGNEVKEGETGELCMRGSCLALGYYNNADKTAESFVQNPFHQRYPDRIYHTGDLVHYNENGDLIYVSRKDFQIKHMGYRIELGEIETAAGLAEGIKDCACIYDTQRKKIVLIYSGTEWNEKELKDELLKRIPQYMIPNKIVRIKQMPHNANGKIDRKELKRMNDEKGGL